jgi:hypothetical protein
VPSCIVNSQEDVRWTPCIRIHERTCERRQFFAVPQAVLVVSASSARHRTSRRFWTAASCAPSFLRMGGGTAPVKRATLLVARSSRMTSGRQCTLRLSTKSREQAIYLEGKFDASCRKRRRWWPPMTLLTRLACARPDGHRSGSRPHNHCWLPVPHRSPL